MDDLMKAAFFRFHGDWRGTVGKFYGDFSRNKLHIVHDNADKTKYIYLFSEKLIIEIQSKD
jgi:hypothetical protein